MYNDRMRITEDEDIDPASVDVISAGETRRGRKAVPVPHDLRASKETTRRRVASRPQSPGVMLEPSEVQGYVYTSPHDDMSVWELQICDAFGSRGMPSALAFLDQLTGLCRVGYDVDDEQWKPSETELNFALAFVNNIRPRNQMEAALAAQMVAVHLMQMRVSAQALTANSYVDPRDAAVAGKLARTFAIQMDAFGRMRGRGTSRQSIRVRKDNHVHYHVHGGAQGSGAEPRAARAIIEASSFPAEGSALPGQDETGTVMPLTSRKRKAGV